MTAQSPDSKPPVQENAKAGAHPAVFAIAGFLVFLGLLVFGTMAFLSDETPEEFPQLKIDRVNPAPNDNAFTLLKSYQANALSIADEEKPQLRDTLAGKQPLDKEWALDVLEENENLLEAWATSWERPFCEMDPIDEGLWEELPYVSAWMQVSELEELRAYLLSARDDRDEALEEILRMLNAGRRIETAKGPLIAVLVGATIKSRGMRALCRLADMSPPESVSETREWCAELENRAPMREVLADAFRVELEGTDATLNLVLTGKRKVKDLADLYAASGRKYGNALAFRLFLRPHKTRNRMAAFYAQLVDEMDNPYPDMNLPKSPGEESGWRWRMLFSNNAIGNLLCSVSSFPTMKLVDRGAGIESRVAATQAYLALRHYHETHDSLPDNLSALMPDYFDTLPIDAYDGKPIRYSKDKAIVYSIGPDRKDEGGNPDAESWKSKGDPTLKLKWLPSSS